MDYKISTSSFDILNSGSLIVPPNEYIQFEIEGLYIRFTFSESSTSNNGKKDSKVRGSISKIDGKDCLVFDVVNFDSLFSSPISMLEVGTIKGKKLYVRFSIVPLGGNEDSSVSRFFHYTWYLAKS